MLTGSASTALLLIPLDSKDGRARTSPPFNLTWSSLPTLLTVPATVPSGGGGGGGNGGPIPPPPMDRVCPYPHRPLPAPSPPPTAPMDSAPPLPPPRTPTDPSAPPPPYSLDFERLRATVSRLEASGWYYGQLSWQQATSLLDQQPLGTFLLRDSSDPQFLFALSVQTERGPTSIRIHYRDGQFQLDAEERLNQNMPFFECVVALVDHYVRLSQTDKAKGHVWLDFFGRRDLRVRLGRPLRHRVPALQHLSRLTINACVPVQRIGELDHLPRVLRSYLQDYPYRR